MLGELGSKRDEYGSMGSLSQREIRLGRRLGGLAYGFFRRVIGHGSLTEVPATAGTWGVVPGKNCNFDLSPPLGLTKGGLLLFRRPGAGMVSSDCFVATAGWVMRHVRRALAFWTPGQLPAGGVRALGDNCGY